MDEPQLPLELLQLHAEALSISTRIIDTHNNMTDAVLKELQPFHHVGIVVDANLLPIPDVARCLEAVKEQHPVTLYTDVHENPTVHNVTTASKAFSNIDVMLVIGGGSAMDTAKIANLLAATGETCQDFWPTHRTDRLVVPPLVVVPTTAGTGSDVQSYALISDDVTHRKMAIGHSSLAAVASLLDRNILVSCPHRVMVLAGFDALSHALEAAVTKTATDASTTAAIQAAELLYPALQQLVHAGVTSDHVRAALQAGSTLAGMAIERSMLGAAHGFANPLTAQFSVVHGQAVAVCLPAVIEINRQIPQANMIYLEIEARIGAKEPLTTAVRRLVTSLGLHTNLTSLGISEPDLPELSRLALQQWTCSHNPYPVTEKNCLSIYQSVLH